MMIYNEIPVQNNKIEITTVGPGFGEAILIKIDKKFVIGIDCCYSLFESDISGKSILEKKLDDLESDAYICWVLTHFHGDHFESFSSLLNLYGDKFSEIIVPNAYTEKDIWQIVVEHETKKSYTFCADVASKNNKNEFIRINSLLIDESLDQKCKQFTGSYNVIDTKLKTPSGLLFPLKINIYGPSRKLLGELIGRSLSKILSDKEKSKISALANKGCYFVHIICGNFEGLFLADTPIKRVENWLENYRDITVSEHFFLKVAHHGSKDGTSDKLLKLFSKSLTSPLSKTAMIAPFNSNKLPSKDILKLLSNNGYEIKQTSNKVSKENESKIRQDLFMNVDSVKFTSGSSFPTNMVTVEYTF